VRYARHVPKRESKPARKTQATGTIDGKMIGYVDTAACLAGHCKL